MKSKGLKLISVFLTIVTLFCICSVGVSAIEAKNSSTNTWGKAVYKEAQDISLKKEGGGTCKLSNVYTTKGSFNGNFTKLTSESKRDALTEVLNASNKVSQNSNYSKFTEEDEENWLEEIQNTNGIGSQLMAAILQNTKPDYVKANKIYKPFSGIVGTVLGLGAILIVALLGVSMTLDIAYMTIPAFRLALGDADGKGSEKPKFISHEALHAINLAEGQGGSSQQGGSGNKQTLIIYLKGRIVMLMALGICLLYLVSGQIYTLVSWVLDLVSGFI